MPLDPLTPRSPRDVALDAAADPIPAAIARGPVARTHWRHALDVDAALASAVVDTPTAPREFAALLSELHAEALDPSGTAPLARPSPLGREVLAAVTGSPSWGPIADASCAHPLVAREAITALAAVVLDATKRAGATANTDTRVSLADLDAHRRAQAAARLAEANAKTPDEKRKALRDGIAADEAVERAEGACAADEGIAARAGSAIDDAHAVLARIADEAGDRAEAAHAFSAAIGNGQGVGGTMPISDELLAALSPEVVRMLRMVGAMRQALAVGRAARHIRGREGMIGPTHVGLDAVADLTPMSLAGLAGQLGPQYAALTRLALVESRADGYTKGGGVARDGDVVPVVDKSGSMRAHNAAPDTWASAVAMTLILEARADGRNVGLVTYDGAVRFAAVVDSPATLAAAVIALATPAGGSNNERAALQAASVLLSRMPHGGHPADVTLITDGQWEATNLDGTDFGKGGPDAARLRGVFIGGTAPVGAAFASTWEVRAAVGDGTSTGADMSLAVEIAAVTV